MINPVIAQVVEVLRDDKVRGRGNYEFAAKPSPNDRLTVPAPNGDLEIMEVLYVEHGPVQLPRDDLIDAGWVPSLTVYVKFLSRFSG